MTTTTTAPAAPPSGQRAEHIYPTLTPAQLARIAAHGRRRQVERGEVLVEAGEQTARFFVVAAGRIDIFRRSQRGEELVVSFGPGMFTGEVTMLSGRRGLAQIRAGAVGEVIEVGRDDLLALIQTDGELSEILMRAFILRRLELIARGSADVVLLGSRHSAGTLRIKEFLARNGHPVSYIDLEQDAEAQEFLDRFHIGVADVPVLICGGRTVLKNPTNQKIAECLGLNAPIDHAHVRDTVVVGAGPGGRARFGGWGVTYGATTVGAAPCGGEEMIVVGGGTSAGQAAVFLAQSVRRVYMLVRAEGLAETMSRYLIRRIEQSPAIELRTRTEVVALEGGDAGLEAVRWRDNRTMAVERRELGHVFVMTGADPATRWLAGCVALDDK